MQPACLVDISLVTTGRVRAKEVSNLLSTINCATVRINSQYLDLFNNDVVRDNTEGSSQGMQQRHAGGSLACRCHVLDVQIRVPRTGQCC